MIKDQINRVGSFKAIHLLHNAGIHHQVIAVFMTHEGLPISAEQVSALVAIYDECGHFKVPHKKIRAMIRAKDIGQQDEMLPCPV